MTRTETAQSVADRLNADTEKRFTARVWTGGESVRVYTGHKSEYLDITDGTVRYCKTNMTWGHVIDEIVTEAQRV